MLNIYTGCLDRHNAAKISTAFFSSGLICCSPLIYPSLFFFFIPGAGFCRVSQPVWGTGGWSSYQRTVALHRETWNFCMYKIGDSTAFFFLWHCHIVLISLLSSLLFRLILCLLQVSDWINCDTYLHQTFLLQFEVFPHNGKIEVSCTGLLICYVRRHVGWSFSILGS